MHMDITILIDEYKLASQIRRPKVLGEVGWWEFL